MSPRDRAEPAASEARPSSELLFSYSVETSDDGALVVTLRGALASAALSELRAAEPGRISVRALLSPLTSLTRLLSKRVTLRAATAESPWSDPVKTAESLTQSAHQTLDEFQQELARFTESLPGAPSGSERSARAR